MDILYRFSACRGGNVGVLFGLMAIPILGLVGAAMDYAIAARDRSSIQDAIDAGALAGSRLLNVQSEAQARAQADAVARVNMLPHLRTMPLDIQVVNNGQSLRIAASRSVPTSILQVIGRNSIEIAVATTALAPAYREIELVLALDNTGSMNQQGKIQALRASTLELLRMLESSGRRPGDVRVGIVPFDRMVRLGVAYRNAPWLRNVPAGWDGCIWDRDAPFNTDDSAPNGNPRRFEAVQCASAALTPLQPLTSDFGTLRNVVNAMTPAGNTNVTIGVVWGWHLLSSNEPFSETRTTGSTNIDRWLVVLTDGDNTQDRWTQVSWFNPATAIDNRTRAACNNLRAQANDIRVLTVRVIDGSASLLRSCASNENYYYEVSDASELIEVFRRIAWEITALRLTN